MSRANNKHPNYQFATVTRQTSKPCPSPSLSHVSCGERVCVTVFFDMSRRRKAGTAFCCLTFSRARFEAVNDETETTVEAYIKPHYSRQP